MWDVVIRVNGPLSHTKEEKTKGGEAMGNGNILPPHPLSSVFPFRVSRSLSLSLKSLIVQSSARCIYTLPSNQLLPPLNTAACVLTLGFACVIRLARFTWNRRVLLLYYILTLVSILFGLCSSVIKSIQSELVLLIGNWPTSSISVLCWGSSASGVNINCLIWLCAFEKKTSWYQISATEIGFCVAFQFSKACKIMREISSAKVQNWI